MDDILDLNASDPNPDWLGSRFQPYSFELDEIFEYSV